MLEYEKKLHFDKRYEKSCQSVIGRIVCSVLWCLIVYALVVYAVKIFRYSIPDIMAWEHCRKNISICQMKFSPVELVIDVAGLIICIIEAVRLSKITAQNHSVRNVDDGTSKGLLTKGYYGQARHPMYGVFIMIYVCMFSTFHSVLGIALTIAFIAGQYINAIMEEKRILIPRFNEDYSTYQDKVHNIVMTKRQIIVAGAIILTNIVGLFF